MPRQHARLVAYGFVVVMSLTTVPVPRGRSQSTGPDLRDLTNKSLEDLMNVTVTSASKKEEKLSRTAAAVFVITQADISRSGATNIPDLLRMVPGLDVGEINGSTWAISSRGFNAQFSNKLLVMIDRRVVYTATFAGVFWDTLDLPLEDIERVEVIRGPGGTTWGANAVDGVISIFTKKASQSKGGMVSAGGGNIQQGFGVAQYGGDAGPATDYRIYAKYFNQYQMSDPTGSDGADGWHALRGGFRTDSTLTSKDSLMFEGDLSNGREGEFGYALPSVTTPALLPVSEQVTWSNGSLETRWDHKLNPQSETSLQFSFNRFIRRDPLNPELRDTFNLDFQHHLAVGRRQDIVWGGGYELTKDDIGGSLTVAMNPVSRDLQVFDGFAQDQIALLPNRLYLTVGTKLEHNDYTGFELMPSARASWGLSDHDMLWAAVSRALRAPSRNDTNLLVNVGSFFEPDGTPVLLRVLGNPNFQDEKLIAYEAGYRASISDHLSIDLAAYYNDYDRLETLEPSSTFFEPTPLPAHLVETSMYENRMYGEAHGLEIAANWRVADRWTLSPGYAFEQIHMHTDPTSRDMVTPLFVENGAPHNSAQLRSHFDLPRGLAWDTSVYYVDPLTNQGYSAMVVIPGYTRLDSGVTWQLREHLSLSVVGQNLLRERHLEFEDVFGSLQSGEIKRSGYAKLTWRF
jgi:iron complex outermembrane recepter protein